ncbi:uncharacterized protein GIQ15_03404 [Arthroderma uncinatum]|uniref:uncharacterized protein n=1 Tax=Arthroderma uncinatum TaxID=74035 RepID=UPI00144AAA5F|nr:uncharacterized protein GIQ15_03404 [Arthroderma uncinatum]KAF3484080.1 hypothetical protein GIQ15_03404 [Arthroderma uncinatum]
MPKASAKDSSALGIRLEGDLVYAPGDTIIGCVWRGEHTVSVASSVDIELYARTKSKKITKNGQTTSEYRNRFTLIEGAQTRQRLFSGPIHIPPGNKPEDEKSWPFAITLPSRIPEPEKVAPETSQEYSYLPLDRSSLANTPLPPNFFGSSYGLNYQVEGYVEYVLEAHLTTTTAADRITRTFRAARPLLVSPRILDLPLVDLGSHLVKTYRGVKTLRLIPGNEEAKLTFKQKTKMFFGTSSIPKMCFDLEVVMPRSIQLDHPDTLPVRLRVVPDPSTNNRESSSPELLQGPPPKVKLTSLRLTIKTNAEVRCGGTFHPHHGNVKSKHALVDYDTFIRLRQAVFIPCACTDKESSPTYVDVSSIFGIRPKQTADLCPDFTTFNIRVTHLLKWDIDASIAGEVVNVSGERPIVILPASEFSR